MKKAVILLLIMFSSVALAELRVRPTEWAQPLIGSSLDNIYQVDDGVFRSEQPDDSEFKEIFNLGVKEVLNLREYHSDDGEAEGLDLDLHRIRIATGSISEGDVIEALQIISNRSGPILVHCWHGSDRTGAIIASYRVVIEGWSKEKAIEELADGGYGYHSSVYPNIVELIKDLDVEKIRSTLASGT